MPVFRNVFGCSNIDKDREHNEEMDNLKERINRLEMKYDNLKDVLNEIKMNIEIIKLQIIK